MKKKYPISPSYIKEVEDRVGDSLYKEIIGEDIDLLAETVLKVIQDMEKAEVIFREVTFEKVIFEVDIIIIQVEIGKIEGHGDNLRSRERERRVRSPSSSRSGSRTSMNRDRIRCFKCREYDTL